MRNGKKMVWWVFMLMEVNVVLEGRSNWRVLDQSI